MDEFHLTSFSSAFNKIFEVVVLVVGNILIVVQSSPLYFSGMQRRDHVVQCCGQWYLWCVYSLLIFVLFESNPFITQCFREKKDPWETHILSAWQSENISASKLFFSFYHYNISSPQCAKSGTLVTCRLIIELLTIKCP